MVHIEIDLVLIFLENNFLLIFIYKYINILFEEIVRIILLKKFTKLKFYFLFEIKNCLRIKSFLEKIYIL